MNPFFLRRPQREDLAQVATLMNTYAQAFIGRPATTSALLQVEWQSADLATCAWVVEKAGRIVGYLLLHETDWQRADEKGKSYRIWGCVDPRYPTSSVRKLLLTAVEDQAAEQGVIVEIDYRTNVEDGAMVQVLQDCDYTVTRTFWQMRRDLDTLPQAPAEVQTITIRAAANEHDQREIYDLHMRSFCDQWNFNVYPYEMWLQALTAYLPAYDPALWLIAEAGGEKIAFIIGTPGQFTVPEMGYAPETGYIHLMGTRADWRGKGIAKALLYAEFAAFRQRGLLAASIGVDVDNPTGAAYLYKKVGMRKTMAFDLYRKVIRPQA